MISIEYDQKNDSAKLVVSVKSPIVYLDQCMIQFLAKDSSKYSEFIEAFSKKNGTIYFSMMNLLEILSLDTGKDTYRYIRDFIDAIGNNFAIIDINPDEVIKRERGVVVKSLPPPLDEEWSKEILLKNKNLMTVSFANFLDSLAAETSICEAISTKREQLKDSIKRHTDAARHQYRTSAEIKKNVDSYSFSPPKSGPCTDYICGALTNSLIRINEDFSKNDSIDYHHAIVTTAYSDLVVLDDKWARRLRNLNLPNSAATVYGISQKDDFLDRLKNW